MPFPLSLEFVLDNTVDNIEKGYIKSSELHGFGLFAKDNIAYREILCQLTGQIMDKKNYEDIVKRLTPMTKDLSFYFLMECNHIVNQNELMVRSFRTKFSYLNHSKKPNCYFDISTATLYALRDIQKEEELTFDYTTEPLSEIYYKNNKDWLLENVE